MAHLDNLIDSVQDPELRNALQSEVRKALNNRQFGLVFNPHKPESIVLPGFKVRRGDKVRVLVDGTNDRTETDDSGVWIVLSVRNETATLRSKTDAHLTREAAYDRLVVVREFGDPIYPGLRSTDRIERVPEKPWHALINGENFHALQALLYPYEGKVDAIYIDPPYNTGARDWKYNNDYVDTTDPYKHSKWLSMMERRLRIAKRLLNPRRSVLIVAIDEKEYLRLGLLLEQVFPSTRIQMISTVISQKGSARTGEFSRCNEFLYFVQLGEATPLPQATDMLSHRETGAGDEVEWGRLTRNGANGRRTARPNLHYPIFFTTDGKFHSVGKPLPVDADRSVAIAPKDTIAVFPTATDGTEMSWSLSHDKFEEYVRHDYVKFGNLRPDAPQPVRIYYLTSGYVEAAERGEIVRAPGRRLKWVHRSSKTMKPMTVWNVPSHNASEGGTNLLKRLLPDRRFPFPKSLYAVEDALRFFVADQPHALVLDFFAGSGTTAHAVARLNRQDGGRRRSILVTNNEVSAEESSNLRARNIVPGDSQWEAIGICEYITKPRLRAAFTGNRPDGEPVVGDYKFHDEFPMSHGFPENVEFFDLTYEDPALISLGRRFSAIAPLLWIKAGAQGARIDQIDSSGWSVPEDGTYGVLFDTTTWSDFVKAANARHSSDEPLTHAFVVTDSHSEYQQIVSRLDPTLDTTRLYADYLRTFEINTVDE